MPMLCRGLLLRGSFSTLDKHWPCLRRVSSPCSCLLGMTGPFSLFFGFLLFWFLMWTSPWHIYFWGDEQQAFPATKTLWCHRREKKFLKGYLAREGWEGVWAHSWLLYKDKNRCFKISLLDERETLFQKKLHKSETRNTHIQILQAADVYIPMPPSPSWHSPSPALILRMDGSPPPGSPHPGDVWRVKGRLGAASHGKLSSQRVALLPTLCPRGAGCRWSPGPWKWLMTPALTPSEGRGVGRGPSDTSPGSTAPS